MKDHDDPPLIEAVRTMLRITRHLQKACDREGISLQQYTTLTWIAHHRITRPYSLAELNVVSRPAVAALIVGLEKKGLLKRKTVKQDGRGIHLLCTKKAYRLLENLEDTMVATLVEVLGDSVDIIAQLGTIKELDEALDKQTERDIQRNSA